MTDERNARLHRMPTAQVCCECCPLWLSWFSLVHVPLQLHRGSLGRCLGGFRLIMVINSASFLFHLPDVVTISSHSSLQYSFVSHGCCLSLCISYAVHIIIQWLFTLFTVSQLRYGHYRTAVLVRQSDASQAPLPNVYIVLWYCTLFVPPGCGLRLPRQHFGTLSELSSQEPLRIQKA